MTGRALESERRRRARLANMRQELLAPVAALVGYGEMLLEKARGIELGDIDPDRLDEHPHRVLILLDRVVVAEGADQRRLELPELGFAAFDAGRETAREGLVVGRGSDRVDA